MKLLREAELVELIEAGDAMKAEIEIDAAAFEESGDFTQAEALLQIRDGWMAATEKHRGTT